MLASPPTQRSRCLCLIFFYCKKNRSLVTYSLSGSKLPLLFCVCGVSFVLPLKGAGPQAPAVAAHLSLISSSAADLKTLPAGPRCCIVVLTSPADGTRTQIWGFSVFPWTASHSCFPLFPRTPRSPEKTFWVLVVGHFAVDPTPVKSLDFHHCFSSIRRVFFPLCMPK